MFVSDARCYFGLPDCRYVGVNVFWKSKIDAGIRVNWVGSDRCFQLHAKGRSVTQLLTVGLGVCAWILYREVVKYSLCQLQVVFLVIIII